MNQATAPSRPLRDGAERLLAGLVPAQTLYTAVCADPSAPLRVSVVGQGGSGKSVLLAALELAYSAAGVSVVGRSAVAAGLAQGADVAVLIDDAHQLDGPELDRLLHLVLTGPVRLVLAYRPWPRKPELDGLEDALSRHHPPVLLGRLDRRGVQNRCTALLGEAPSAETVDLLCEQTGGVPLLIDRVVSSLRTGGRFSGDRVGLPPDVLDRVRHDLNRLAPQLRAMLLAVGLGAAPDVEILADVLALDPVVVADLLSMAQASGLLLDEGGVIPLVRRVMVAGAAPGTKRVTQRLVLATHLERGRPVLELAHQLLDAGARGSDLATVFESAGDAALSHSSVAHLVRPEPAAAQAVQLYAHAVTAGADPASLAPRRAEASALAGDLDGALRFADQALSDRACADLARAGTVAAAVLAQRGLLARSAEVYRWVGPLRMGSAAPLAALVLLGTGSLTEARTVLAASDGNRPPTLLAGAESLMTTGVLESIVGSPMAAGTTALSTLTQAAALLEPGGRAVLLPDTPAALAAIVALHCGELDVAVSVLERALATGAGGLTARPRCQLLLAWTAMIRGDTALARRWLARTVADTSGLEPREELFAAALAVGLARRESNIPTLQTVWAAAREAIVRHPPNLFALLPLGELAVAAARLQDFDRVAPHLEQARILLERLGDPPLWAAPLHWYGLHAAILREQPEAVEPHATALVKAAKSNHYAAVLAAAGRAWVQVLAGQFDPSEVESAARALQSIGLANDGSRLAGQAAIRSTDRKVMVALLGCARALQATGPGAASSAVDGSIANGVAVGVGPKQGEPMLGGPTHSGTGRAGVVDPPAPVGGSRVAAVPATAPMLSSREREVAELILTGLTYRQIGERLFISAKTVEHHVARMRQRLDVGSRDELFAQLRLFVGASGT